MKKIFLPLFPLSLLLFLTSCDSGNIESSDNAQSGGRSIKVSAAFSGIDAWPEAYSLVLATWGTDETKPLSSVVIEKPTNEGDAATAELDGIGNEAKKISISIISKGRSLIHTYSEKDLPEGDALDMGEIDVAEMKRVQEQVFNLYCARCHGAGNSAAAGLNLTEGKAHESLVGITSKKSETGKKLIVAGDPGKSFLLDVLSTDIIGYNHTDVLPEAELKTLIRTWVAQGAKQ